MTCVPLSSLSLLAHVGFLIFKKGYTSGFEPGSKEVYLVFVSPRRYLGAKVDSCVGKGRDHIVC